MYKRQPLAQRGVADLQHVQHAEHGGPVVGGADQVGRGLGQLHVLDHLGQDPVELDGLQVVPEVLPGLALDLVGALHELRERPELGDPLGRGLLADARDARQVVGRVAAQRREVRVLLRGEAVLLHDLLRGEPGELGDALGRVEHGGVLGDELEGVPVAGDDQHVEAGRLRLRRQRRDHVVGLEAVDREPRHVHRVEQLADQLDLPLELVGGLGAVRLVLGELRRAPRLAGDVERHREVRGGLVAQRVRQHRRETVDGVGRLPRRGREILRGQREERPVGQGVPVHEHQAGTVRCGRLVGLLR